MDNFICAPDPVEFKAYGRALEWGYPRGVGYRYVNLSQSLLLLRIARLPDPIVEDYTSAMLDEVWGAR